MTSFVIVGMNSTSTDNALVPDKPNSSAQRMINIVNEFFPGSMDHKRWLKFDRKNVLTYPVWDLKRAKKSAVELRPYLEDKNVLILGRETMRALGLFYRSSNIGWWQRGPKGMHFCNMPHPSGLNRYYNDPDMRKKLADILYHRSR